jgi:hypothetical protein
MLSNYVLLQRENRLLMRFLSDFVFEIGGACHFGAGDGIRTRDNLLGRQGLYQLSYSRIFIELF